MFAQGHNVSVSVGAVDVYGQRKSTMCLVVRGNNILCAQRKFKNEFRRQPLHVNNIPRSLKQSKETGSVCREIHMEDLPWFSSFFIFSSGGTSRILSEKLEICNRICAAIGTVMTETLSRVLQEAHYRLDICRATNGTHIFIEIS